MNYNEAKNGEARSAKPRLEKGTLNHDNPESVPEAGQTQRTLNDVYPIIANDRDTSNGWYTKVMTFESGDVECIALRLESDQAIRQGGGAKRENQSKPEMDENVLKKSQVRAKKQVRHKSMMMNADRLLTLTYRENMTDLERGWSDLKAFSRKMKDEFGDKWQYICVPEFQKRGAVHFHMAISGFLPVKVVRQKWREVVGEGNIDITDPRDFDKNSWNPRRIAQYLAKYITKNDSVEFNKRRYSSTRIPAPPFITGWLPVSVNLTIDTILSSVIAKLTDITTRDIFQTKDSYFPLIMVTT